MSRFHTSGGCGWNSPRPYTDPSLRRHHYGRIIPMDLPRRRMLVVVGSVLKRLLRSTGR